MTSSDLELVSHHLCPYVQRSVIVLTEKNIPHKRTYIDLGNKPEWFKKISATGKVPLLRVNDDDVLFESMVICEYLNETTPGSLHPEDSLRKAQHRSWNEFASQILNNIGQLYNAKTPQAFTDASEQLRLKFERLEQEITLPYFSGPDFCMTDAAFGPVFRYFDVIDEYLDTDLFSGLDKVKKWRNVLSERASVKQAVTADYPERLTTFLLNRNSHLSSLIESQFAELDHA
ncbi:glutathione S-transferase family protein [Litoribrevibacter albus]|uniref:Glutathione S-transferase n=1 Tax=Litoribrevibacter albus TaxID=1473156 RepID=A0AA37SA85_9GAMM|nr:glutathione S-transferase family protein [Litoribrevibacter albus]GLQ30992.1 glutathione S-transferase [Litoribrevibacter albus]